MHWYYIMVKDIKTTIRDKAAWILMLIVPLIVLIIAGFALSGVFKPSIPQLKLGYLYSSSNEKNIEPILHSFEDLETIELVKVNSKNEGMNLLEDSSITGLLMIPNDFNVNSVNAEYKLDFYYNNSSQSTADVLKGIVQGVVRGLNDSLVSVDLLIDEVGPSINADKIDSIVNKVRDAFHDSNKVSFQSYGIGGDNANRSFYQVIPGFAVMFLLFSILAGANKIIEERNNKTLRRILISPTKKSDIIIGKWAGMMIEGFIQVVILFIAGKLIFNISLGDNPLKLVLFLFILACVTASVGVFIASIVRTFAQANGISMMAFMVMSALGGSWWPIDITPDFMQTIGKFTINYWAISGVKKLILFNQGMTSVLGEIGVLVLIGCLFMYLSFQCFRFE